MSNLSAEDVLDSWAESLRQRVVRSHRHRRYKVSCSPSFNGQWRRLRRRTKATCRTTTVGR